MTNKVTPEDIEQVAKDTANTVAAEFAPELSGDFGPNGPDIDDSMLNRLFGRAAVVTADEFKFKASQAQRSAFEIK